eukprot:gene8110-8303_t
MSELSIRKAAADALRQQLEAVQHSKERLEQMMEAKSARLEMPKNFILLGMAGLVEVLPQLVQLGCFGGENLFQTPPAGPTAMPTKGPQRIAPPDPDHNLGCLHGSKEQTPTI